MKILSFATLTYILATMILAAAHILPERAMLFSISLGIIVLIVYKIRDD